MTSHASSSPASSAHGHGHGGGHIASVGTLLGTWITLLVLTALTVWVSRIDLGTLNIVVALAVASVKATLVALFFMHLKYEDKFQTVIWVASIFFALLLAGFTLLDTTQNAPYRAAREADLAARKATTARVPAAPAAPPAAPAAAPPAAPAAQPAPPAAPAAEIPSAPAAHH